MRGGSVTLDDQSGEKTFLYQRRTEEDCNSRSWVKRQKECVGGFFSHTVSLSETSAPLEIVSRLFGTKLITSIILGSRWTCFMQPLNLGISEVPSLFFFNLQSLPSYFPWTCQSPDLNAFFLDGESKVWKTSRNLSEAKDKEWTSQFWIETTKPLCLHPSNVYWVTNLCRILFRSLACVKNQNKRWFRLSWLERSSYFT